MLNTKETNSLIDQIIERMIEAGIIHPIRPNELTGHLEIMTVDGPMILMMQLLNIAKI